MNLDLKGQIICITGGSEGIGLATAKAFAQAFPIPDVAPVINTILFIVGVYIRSDNEFAI